jgi:hypothetical protein
MAIDIKSRRPLQQRTLTAIIQAANDSGAVASVMTHKGVADEVHLFRGRKLVASIFKPTSGRLGIWRRADNHTATANTPAEAVRRALDPLRKHTRKLSEVA